MVIEEIKEKRILSRFTYVGDYERVMVSVSRAGHAM